MNIEVWASFKALSQLVSLFFDCEVGAESGQVHISCFMIEKVRPAEPMLYMISWSALHSASCIFTRWSEGIAEVRVQDSAITIFIVSPNE